MPDKSKKQYNDESRPGDGPSGSTVEQYFPSALLGKALGFQDWKEKYPKPDQKGKGDRADRVGLSDIRKQYAKKGKRK